MDIDIPATNPEVVAANANANANANTMSGTERPLFVVQRCWHSGPQQYQPMDLLRLFPSQRDAEEAAYHSAHAWCRHHKPDMEPQVRTLLLPSYPACIDTGGSSYGFVAYGCLFWVRSLVATSNLSRSLNLNINGMGNEHGEMSSHQHQWNAEEAYAVVTQGVIGGTGNRMSRRGTETPYGRVFVAESETRTVMNHTRINNYAAQEVMHRKAMEACHHSMAQLGLGVGSTVLKVALGRPSEYTSGQFLKDWPAEVLQPNNHPSQVPHVNPLPQDHVVFHHKRRGDDDMGGGFGRTVSHDEMYGEEVACPFEQPPAPKRRRFCDDNGGNAFFQPPPHVVEAEENMLMMGSSYGIMGEQA